MPELFKNIAAWLTTSGMKVLGILIALVVIYVSITVIRLALPLKLIATTSGKDISHLMEFMQELGRICRVCRVCLIVVCALIAASLVLAIVVFKCQVVLECIRCGYPRRWRLHPISLPATRDVQR